MMYTFLIITALLIIVTKYLDCRSTILKVRRPEKERNPGAARLMKKIGFAKAVWVIFAVSVLITAAAFAGVIIIGKIEYEIAFLIIGLFVSSVQGAVAYTNFTGSPNIISGMMCKIFRW